MVVVNPFSVKPKHWWEYLNPFWWRRKRVIETVLRYEWEKNGMQEKVEKAIRDSVLYGEGSVEYEP